MFNKPSAVINNSNGVKLYDNSEKFQVKESDGTKKKSYLKFSEILNVPPRQWLLTEWFGRCEVGMVYGPSSCGKSFVMIDLLFDATLGKTFAGKFEFSERLKCLYVCGEGSSGVKDRIKARAAMQNLPDDFDDYFFMQDHILDLTDDRVVQAFIDEYKPLNIDLIVIDTLSRATSGANENDNTVMADALKRAERIAREFNAVVIIVHHSSKGSGEPRGASSIKNNIDFVIAFSRNEKGRHMNAEKLKDGSEWEPKQITFELKSVENLDGGSSAVVNWLGDTNTDSKPITIIKNYVKNSNGMAFTNNSLFEELKQNKSVISANTIRAEVLKLRKDGVFVDVDDKDEKKRLGFNSKEAVFRYKPF